MSKRSLAKITFVVVVAVTVVVVAAVVVVVAAVVEITVVVVVTAVVVVSVIEADAFDAVMAVLILDDRTALCRF